MDSSGTLPRRRRRNTMDKIKSALLQTYHKDSYMAHRRDWRLGHEGRYRRTLSPCRPLSADVGQLQQQLPPPQPTSVSRSVSCAAGSCSPCAAAAVGSVQLRQTLAHGKSSRKDDRRPASAVFCSELRPVREWDTVFNSAISSISFLRDQFGDAERSVNTVDDKSSSKTSQAKKRRSWRVQEEVVPDSDVDVLSESSERGTGVGARLDANGNFEKAAFSNEGGSKTCSEPGVPLNERLISSANPGQSLSSANNQSSCSVAARPSTENLAKLVDSDTAEDSNTACTTQPETSDVESRASVNGSAHVSSSTSSCEYLPPTPSNIESESTGTPSCSSQPGSPSESRKPRRKNNAPADLHLPFVTVSPAAFACSSTPSPGGRSSLPSYQTLPARLQGVLRTNGDGTQPRPSARDLLDPRRLPEAAHRAEQLWNGTLASTDGRSNDLLLPERRWSALCFPAAESERTPSDHETPLNGHMEAPTSSTTGLHYWTERSHSPVSTLLTSPSAVLENHCHDLIDHATPTTSGHVQGSLETRLCSELRDLRDRHQQLEERKAENATLGAAVTARVTQLLRPSEAEHYRVCIDQVGVITSLLLCLEGRQQRTRAALSTADHMPSHQQGEMTRRLEKISARLEEARLLEQGVLRRRRQVDACLERYLSTEEFHRYQTFVGNKAELIRRTRQVESRMRAIEERLASLRMANTSSSSIACGFPAHH